MRGVEDAAARLLADRLEAELFDPVGRAGQLVLLRVPLANDVVGLFHDDLVAFREEVELVLYLAGLGDVDEDGAEIFLAVLARVEAGLVEHPDGFAPRGDEAVFDLDELAGAALLPDLPGNVLAVRRIDEFDIVVVKTLRKLLGGVADEVEHALARLDHRIAAVVAEDLNALDDVLQQALVERTALYGLADREGVRLLPGDEDLALARRVEVDAQDRGFIPDVVPAPGVVDTVAAGALHEAVAEHLFDVFVREVQNSEAVVRVDHFFSKIPQRLADGTAGF